MAKASEITGIVDPVGSYSYNRNFYYPQGGRKKTRQAGSPIHSGEIVQGYIIESLANGYARVKLPNGTFEAKLHNRLRKGDSLFLRVSEVKPVLVLRVYSVYVAAKGNKIPASEIIRMLDLPENELYENIIGVLRTQSNTIVKDEVLMLVNYLTDISDEELEGKELPGILNTLYWMEEASIRIDRNHFQIMYPFLQGPAKFQEHFNSFEDTVRKEGLPDLRRTLKALDLYRSMTKINEAVSFFSKHAPFDIVFYRNLRDIFEKKNISREIRETAGELIKIIDSMHKWNAVANISKVPFQLYVPFPVKGMKNNVTTFHIHHFESPSDFSGKISIVREDPDYDLGVKLHRLEKLNFDMGFSADDPELETKLRNFAIFIRNRVIDRYNLLSVVMELEGEQKDLLPDIPASPSRKISVVI